MIHELKTWPEFFGPLQSGDKPFEVRKDDGEFKVGDILHLREWAPETADYTGRECFRRVTYVLSGRAWGVEYDYCVMGLADHYPLHAVTMMNASPCAECNEIMPPGADAWSNYQNHFCSTECANRAATQRNKGAGLGL